MPSEWQTHLTWKALMPPSPASPNSFQRRLWVTLVSIAAYIILLRLSVPASAAPLQGSVHPNLFYLGAAPIFQAFFLIELLAFFVPPFSRWKRSGSTGRNKLNLSALILTPFFSALQGCDAVNVLENLRALDQAPLDGPCNPFFSFKLMAYFLLGTFVLYGLLHVVTRYGLANGFILYLFLSFLALNIHWYVYSTHWERQVEMTFDEKMNLIYILMAVGLLLLWTFKTLRSPRNPIRRFFWDRPSVTYLVGGSRVQSSSSPIPQTLNEGSSVIIFQGVMLVWGAAGANILNFISGRYFSIFTTVDLTIFSIVFWFLFTSKFWRESQLEGRASLPDGGQRATAYFLFWLCLDWVSLSRGHISEAFSLWGGPASYLLNAVLNFTSWFVIFILGRELYENILHGFRQRDRECLVEMDNVEMAQLWAAQFKEAGIPHHIEGLRYRQITQFFSPYVKMRVWVSTDFRKAALQIMDKEHLKQI